MHIKCKGFSKCDRSEWWNVNYGYFILEENHGGGFQGRNIDQKFEGTSRISKPETDLALKFLHRYTSHNTSCKNGFSSNIFKNNPEGIKNLYTEAGIIST